MEDTVVGFMDEHELMQKGSTVLVGVSGGPDSLALLHFLKELRVQYDFNLIAVTIDHSLREESRADSLYVEEISKKWDIESLFITVDTPNYKQKHQVGTQVAARNLRYEAFEKVMCKYEKPILALAHHGDDQIETMLMQVSRSADPAAILGIPVRRHFANGIIVRPFLCLEKSEILTYCKKNKLKPRVDASNEETDYTRNLYRKKFLPLLKERNERIHTTMQRLSESLTSDEEYLRSEAKKMLEKIVNINELERTCTFITNEFIAYPFPLQRRAYHLILNYLYVNLPNRLSHMHERDFFAFLEGREGTFSIDFPEHLKIQKSYDRVKFYFEDRSHQIEITEAILEVPGQVELPNGVKLTAEYIEEAVKSDYYTYICCPSEVALPFTVRSVQSGDRMEIQGLQGTKKLRRILIDEKIPANERMEYPVIVDASGEIIWLAPIRKGKQANRGRGRQICLRYNK